MSSYPHHSGPRPVRGPAPGFRRRSLWDLVRLALFLLGAAFVFGLLLLASFWFAIPFGLALIALGVALLEIAQRARVGLHVVRSWRVR